MVNYHYNEKIRDHTTFTRRAVCGSGETPLYLIELPLFRGDPKNAKIRKKAHNEPDLQHTDAQIYFKNMGLAKYRTASRRSPAAFFCRGI